jgi:branched-chain amino acid transport system permease protein
MNYFYLFYGWVRQEIFAIPGRIIALIFFALLFTAPLITQEPYYLRIIIMASIFAIFAISWDVLSGVAGQLSLGHALFFGIAAYAAGLLNLKLGWPTWLTIPSGAVVAVFFGLLVGIPALRMRGMYLGLVTLTFPIILTGVLFAIPVMGGELGLSGIVRISRSYTVTYYIVVAVFTASAFVMYKFADVRSKFIRIGVVLHAIREDEITARGSGINTTAYKFLAFAVSGFFAGIAGGLYVHVIMLAEPSTLSLFFSIQAILWAVFGSAGTIYGAVVGVFLLYPMTEILSLFSWGEPLRFLIFAGILILTLLFMPEGISVWILDKIEVKCPRCKLINFTTRHKCRACRAELHPERPSNRGGY